MAINIFELFFSALVMGKILPNIHDGLFNKFYRYGGAHSFGELNG
jgi:hypothetical protein